MSHSVTIRYRYKLFAHKLAQVGNLGSGSCEMSQQQQKARVETAIDWAQVMTKTLVSCAIAPLYENVKCRSREKRNISLMSLLGAKPINIRKNVVSIIQQKQLQSLCPVKVKKKTFAGKV